MDEFVIGGLRGGTTTNVDDISIKMSEGVEVSNKGFAIWTDEEWTVLRNACREHVELEVFLVEAEAGMKARIDEERTPMSGRDYRVP